MTTTVNVTAGHLGAQVVQTDFYLDRSGANPVERTSVETISLAPGETRTGLIVTDSRSLLIREVSRADGSAV